MEEDSIKNSQELLSRIQEEGMSALEEVYRKYREEFLHFALRFGLSESECLDAYQDVMIAFYENVKEGKLTTLTSSLKTYLFSIGKYNLLNQLKNKKRTAPTEAIYPEIEIIDNQYFEEIELTHRQQIIEKAFQQLGEQCRELLTLFYYHRYSIKNIKDTMEYSNDNTVKATKSRCMKSLKTILEKMEIY